MQDDGRVNNSRQQKRKEKKVANETMMMKPRIKGSIAQTAVLVAAIGLSCLPRSDGFASIRRSLQQQQQQQQVAFGATTWRVPTMNVRGQAASRCTTCTSPWVLITHQKTRSSTCTTRTTTTTTTIALLATAFPILSFSNHHHHNNNNNNSFLSIIPLIASDDSWGNWALLTGTAAAAQILGTTTAVGQLLGPPVTAMALTFVLASIGILTPGGTVAAKQLQLFSLQLATPLILLGADLRDAGKRCGPLLISFAAASMATLIASLVGWYGTGSMLSAALGPHDGLVIAAALLAKNIGGGINYIAVCRSLDASPTAIAAGLCVDNIFALVYFPVTTALAKRYPDLVLSMEHFAAGTNGPNGTNGANGSPSSSTSPMIGAVPTQHQKNTQDSIDGLNGANGSSLASSSAIRTRQSRMNGDSEFSMVSVQAISNVLCLTALLLWLGERIGGPTGALPLTTLLTVVLASWMPRTRLEPLQPAAHCLGLVSLYLFFATAGAPGLAVADSVRAALVPLGLFLTSLYCIHGGILTMLNRILGRRYAAFCPQRLLVSSSAAIGGPATAVALAEAAGWKSLSVPSLLVGNVGYAIATFLGIAYFSGLR